MQEVSGISADEASATPVQAVLKIDKAHASLKREPSYASGSAYVVDRFYPLAEASVPITDLGFIRADAVYDVVSVSRGQFFRLADHQERFARSCKRMRLTNPFNATGERSILNELVARTGLKDAYVWWCVTRGKNPANPADRLHAESFRNRFYAFAIPYVFIKDDEARRTGINLHVSRERIRIPPESVDPRAKNFCSLDLAMSLMEAGEQGADWSVLTDMDGNLAEAPGCNVFIVKGDSVCTPDRGCLEGITRQTAIELCREARLRVEARKVPFAELLSASEAFLTSSAGGVIPVSAVNGTQLCERAGPVSVKIHNLYWERRWNGWHGTPVNYGAAS